MAETLKLTILSPERRLVEDILVTSVTLPGSEGQIQILAGHAPMIGTLSTGRMTFIAPNGNEELGVISTGFFEVRDGQVSVMAETVELSGEIDAVRARLAQEKAEEALQSPDLDDHQFRKYQLKLERALVRQQVAAHR